MLEIGLLAFVVQVFSNENHVPHVMQEQNVFYFLCLEEYLEKENEVMSKTQIKQEYTSKVLLLYDLYSRGFYL